MGKSKEAKWSIERKHKVTGEVFYLSPGEVNWVSIQQHEKYGTRYGHWVWGEAEEIATSARKVKPEDFEYVICLFEKIK